MTSAAACLSCYAALCIEYAVPLFAKAHACCRTVASPAGAHVGTCPLAFEIFFRNMLKQVVWFDLVLYQTLNLALFDQRYSRIRGFGMIP